ncbi:microfibril-associated glycoprotein 4-like [Haliotis cracherodii]|uniref:microfibril-associated glycoprotein 4-like n=1 Tax=Haliotis cracherodii TaxID=6455 RepID=UPI0039E96231
MCLNDPQCQSASYCKTIDGYTCQLSGFYEDGRCTEFVAGGLCSHTAIVYPCENGGTFLPENRTCQCAHGFVGDYCHRRYRDCIETPKVIGELYLIKPLGSHSEFEWGCKTPGLNYTEITTIDSISTLDYALTWQQIKRGISLFAGFYILGIENLHQLTKQGRYDMFVILYVLEKAFGYLRYGNFRVDSEAEGYAIHWDYFWQDTSIYPGSDEYLDGFGGAGDAKKNLNGARLGTYDKDINGCASTNNAAWWYNPLGCTTLGFGSDALYWPTNRTGRVALEPIYIAVMGMKPVYWYVEDDLVL